MRIDSHAYVCDLFWMLRVWIFPNSCFSIRICAKVAGLLFKFYERRKFQLEVRDASNEGRVECQIEYAKSHISARIFEIRNERCKNIIQKKNAEK